MLKLSKLTDYGTLVMTVLAAEPGRQRSATEIAEQAHLGLPTVAKLLKKLAHSGLVQSERGARGGYRIVGDPQKITVADVVRVLEGPISITECSVHSGDCIIESSCSARANWQLINTAVRGALEAVTLAQMVTSQRPAKATSHSLIFHRSPNVARG